jgi:hypothetical protein
MLRTAPALRHRSAIDWLRRSQSDSKVVNTNGLAPGGFFCWMVSSIRRSKMEVEAARSGPYELSSVRYWPKADMAAGNAHVRFRG